MESVVARIEERKVREKGIENLIFLVRKYVVRLVSRNMESREPPTIVHSYRVHPL